MTLWCSNFFYQVSSSRIWFSHLWGIETLKIPQIPPSHHLQERKLKEIRKRIQINFSLWCVNRYSRSQINLNCGHNIAAVALFLCAIVNIEKPWAILWTYFAETLSSVCTTYNVNCNTTTIVPACHAFIVVVILIPIPCILHTLLYLQIHWTIRISMLMHAKRFCNSHFSA